MNKSILFVITVSILAACASAGSKTIFNSNKINISTIQSVYAFAPEQENFEYYRKSTNEDYFKIINEQFDYYNIKVIQGDSLILPYINITHNNPALTNELSDLTIICKIKRNTAFGRTMDFRTDYKFLDSQTGELLYESKYSTTFGHTTVGLPSEEGLMRTAIEKGLRNFKKDYLDNK